MANQAPALIVSHVNKAMPSELSVLRRPAFDLVARPPTGARYCSGSGNAITELGHKIRQSLRFWAHNTENGNLGLSHRVSATSVDCQVKCNTLPSRPSLTGWSSRHQQAPLVGTLRASHSGAAYRGR